MALILEGILDPRNYSNKRWRAGIFEQIIKVILLLVSAISIITTVAIVSVMIFEASLFFQNVSIFEFLTETRWTPLYSSKHFGILPLVTGTFLVAFGAMFIALPLGLMSAIYLSEYAPDKVRQVIKPVLEVLAGIPTVVYGYFALLFISPILQSISDSVKVFNAASAAIVMGIMILPMVSSLSEDAMRAVPRSLREGAYALGATKLEVSLRIVTPAAISGIVASFILAISRAIGENDDCDSSRRAKPHIHIQPLCSNSNHDVLYSSSKPWRYSHRFHRIPNNLRGRNHTIYHNSYIKYDQPIHS